MNNSKMYLYGASGHGKVVLDVLLAQGTEVGGFFDDNPSGDNLLGVPVLRPHNISVPLIVSIGDNKTRRKIAETFSCEFGVAIHPSAVVSSFSTIGEGSVVLQNAVVQSSSKVGRHCIINTSASVDHDSNIGDYVHLSPNVALCGHVTIGEGTWVGAGSTIIPGVKVGKWAVIGAGSVVTKDIPDYALAVGNRCEVIKIIGDEQE